MSLPETVHAPPGGSAGTQAVPLQDRIWPTAAQPDWISEGAWVCARLALLLRAA